jgi:hypothetical protein
VAETNNKRFPPADWPAEKWEALGEASGWVGNHAASIMEEPRWAGKRSSGTTVAKYWDHHGFDYAQRRRDASMPWANWTDEEWIAQAEEVNYNVTRFVAEVENSPSFEVVRRKFHKLGIIQPPGPGALTREKKVEQAEERHVERMADRAGRKVEVFQSRIADLLKIIEKNQTEQEMVLDAVERTVQSRKPVSLSMPHQTKSRRAGDETSEHLIQALISDVHIGQLATHEETGGLGEYNWETFLERYEQYQSGFSVIINDILRKAMPIRNIVIAFLGDIGENEVTYKGQPFHIDLLALDQLFAGADYMAALVQFIAGQFENVEVHMVPGNHGRTLKSTLNLDVVLYKMMASLLRDQTNVTLYNSQSHFAAWRVDKNSGHIPFPRGCNEAHDFFAIHGDAVRMYLDQPSYGMCRNVQRYAAACQVPFKYALYGHFHQLGQFGHGHVWANGAWCGASGWTVKQFQGVAEPAQLLLGINAKYGCVFSYPIRFGIPSVKLSLDEGSHVYTPHDADDRD